VRFGKAMELSLFLAHLAKGHGEQIKLTTDYHWTRYRLCKTFRGEGITSIAIFFQSNLFHLYVVISIYPVESIYDCISTK
jgi:hypothetical protein